MRQEPEEPTENAVTPDASPPSTRHGNIPGKTQVVSIAIYDHVESLQYTNAHLLSGGLLIMSFLMLIAVYAINRRFRMVRP